ncbi:MAG TPA: 30S ribosomal protein S4 [Verrucomicrobiales bacterium]|jgi:small subunit ribosomal protein S4|nr:30S ribosomal protein S4 [Verrucomicrobiales bacterium]
MARYTGPKDKISRRFGVAIYGPSKAQERRPFGPGQHGARSGRKKQSDFAVALAEKQKLRYQYGVLEKQFRRIFEEASRRRGVTGEILLQMLECRLDNVVYRLGLANSRNAARQYVSHGHVTVNGKKVNIPSAQVKQGDIIAMKQSPRAQQMGLRALDLTQAVMVPEWLTQDRDKLGGKVNRLPSREEIDPIVNEQLVVELYSR